MKLYFSKKFLQKIKNLSKNIQKIAKKKLDILRENPKHPSLRVKKIQGYLNIFEASINMDIRVTWEHYEEGIYLRNIGHHDEALKNP